MFATATPPPLITVEIAVPSRDCLAVGETIRLEAEIKDALGDYWPRQDPISWRSRDEDVATVDTDGLVTGLAQEPVIIEASFEEDGEIYFVVSRCVRFDALGA